MEWTDARRNAHISAQMDGPVAPAPVRPCFAGAARRFGSLIALATAAAMLTGCAAMLSHDSPLPQDGPVMTEIYRTHLNGKPGEAADALGSTPRDRLPRRGADEDVVNAQRRALSEPLNNRFERLPNPDLVMLVFPHLSPGRTPVPGYYTTFPMYETVQYAMPGEVAPRHQAGGSATYPAPLAARQAQQVELSAADVQYKRHLLTTQEKFSPRAARVLADYDLLYTARCKTALTADELKAVPSSGNVAYERMFIHLTAADYPPGAIPGSELISCNAPARSVARGAN